MRLAGKRLTKDGVIVIIAQAHRDQTRNRAEARARLVDLIRQAAVKPVPRRPTKVPKAQKRAAPGRQETPRRDQAAPQRQELGLAAPPSSRASAARPGTHTPQSIEKARPMGPRLRGDDGCEDSGHSRRLRLAAAISAPIQSRLIPNQAKPMPVRQLPETVVNRIAAGEVVERPASAVKELVENALDAGARRIDVLTDGGGRRLIRVTDDGEGMTRADLALAVERHATSKLDGDDLLAIRTLGFRGEALPSIGAVARLTIATRHKDEPHAWSITVDAGAAEPVKPAALGQGTSVEVRDLFYATPARLKFLKTDRSEAEAVREVVRRLAMSRPDVTFTLAGEERAPVTWAASADPLTRLGDVLGAEFRANAIAIRSEREGVRVDGFAGLPTLSRANSLGAVSGRQRPPGARQAADRRGARRLRRLSAARPPSAAGAHRRAARRARSTSTCIRPRPRCASATARWCAG